MAVICHYYPGINPLNIWDIEYDVLKDLVKALPKKEQE
jgi:hypothetical protein